MHMTGIESFNVASKRGGPANIPMNTTSTGSTGQPLSSGINDSSSQVMDGRTINTNKSSMPILSNKNKNQPGKQQAPSNSNQGGIKSNQSASTGLDQKEKKIYEIYASSGKVMAPIGSSNFNHQNAGGQGGPGNQNAFL